MQWSSVCLGIVSFTLTLYCVTPSISADQLLLSGLNDSSKEYRAGQRPFESSYLARRSRGNLGQPNLILETELLSQVMQRAHRPDNSAGTTDLKAEGCKG